MGYENEIYHVTPIVLLL